MTLGTTAYSPVKNFWQAGEGWQFCPLQNRAILVDAWGETIDWVRIPEGLSVEEVIRHHCSNTHAWKYMEYQKQPNLH